jgi:mannose-1-phosphate guanylyltransferase/mannose-6-phosphate isomerase
MTTSLGTTSSGVLNSSQTPKIFPIILSGGSGTRLWPLSRAVSPKQFHALNGPQTLFQDTVLRLQGTAFMPPIVICNHEHRFTVGEQLKAIDIKPHTILVEPVARNTAPAVAIAALLLENEPDALLLISPADHVIRKPERFQAALQHAALIAQQGYLVTFGIDPATPETGFGYIQRGTALNDHAASIKQFVEKPDRATAERYVADGNYFWNSGIFLFSAKDYLAELERLHPAMLAACRAALTEASEDLFFRRLGDSFAQIKGESIDYAVMEHAAKAAVVPVEMGWSDVGSWSAVWQDGAKNEQGNVLHGDVVTLDTENCYVQSEHKLVATVGVKDLVVVVTRDAVLVSDKKADQQIKHLVETLKRSNRREAEINVAVNRPWGWYMTIDAGSRVHVKQIAVHPGGKLSLQKHWHRSEHWVVVSGSALVTRGDEQFLLRENESTYIPAGEVHRLENPGKVPLRLIEVQSGEYLEEDDIVRVEDVYGRAG